jgi:putative intracellular protease/amidase
MASTLNGRRVAILAADGVERVELEQPRQALEDAGARTEVVSISSGEIQAERERGCAERADQQPSNAAPLERSSGPTPPAGVTAEPAPQCWCRVGQAQ